MLLGGHGVRATARATGVNRNTVGQYAAKLKAGALRDVEEEARPRVRLVAKPGGKRGRIIHTDAGREVTHEEVLRGVTKKTATEIASSGRPTSIVCACSAVVKVSALGPIPTKCRRCAAKARAADPKEKARQRAKWSRIKAARDALKAPDVEALTEAARLLTPEDRKRLAVAILSL